MDYHSLTRKELQTLCKKNKIRANMTNLAMADALSFLPKVRGVESIGNTTPETPLITSRKRKVTAAQPLFDLDIDDNETSSSDTRSPSSENLYLSDIISPKATRTCQEKATGSLAYVVNHPHGTRLASRLKQKSQLKTAESTQKVEGRYDPISIEMLPGEEKDEAVRTKCEATDNVLQNNEGDEVKVSNAEQDDVFSGNLSSNMVYAESLKLAKSGHLIVDLNGDQDATIEETSTTSIMGGVSRDKIARALKGCSSEVSFAPTVSVEKSWNIARTLVRCTSEFSSAPTVSAEKSMKIAHVLNESSPMGKETASADDPNEDQDMKSEDELIDLNEPFLMVDKAETLEASHVDDEKSKLMCELELCDVKVSEDKEESDENNSYVNDDISDVVETFLFAPSITSPIANQIGVHVATATRTSTQKKAFTTPILSVIEKSMTTPEEFHASMKPAEKAMNNALLGNKSLIGGETENTKHPNEDQNMDPIDQPIEINEVVECKGAHHLEVKFIDKDELSNVKGTEVETTNPLMVEKAEIFEDLNGDDGMSKLTCEVRLHNVKVTEIEENNTEDSNVNDYISDAVEKFSFSPSATHPAAVQIPVRAATPTRTTATEIQLQETTPLKSPTMKKVATTPKGSINVLDDKKETHERGQCSVSTPKVATEIKAEQKQLKGENSSQGKLRSTSVRQLKKTIKQLTLAENKNTIVKSDDKNTIVKLNKEAVPEDNENKAENTAQIELKAISARHSLVGSRVSLINNNVLNRNQIEYCLEG
ncbi:hypothetical protein MKW94_017271 [Papaver nudicaule]|uniref:Uncharacterized protein n=1 Tax=Papaver nudicaule TaxID=74823 RepID=A0AA41VS26_PAPNU|nr:hypothetical protein [Papaver nudicaule]